MPTDTSLLISQEVTFKKYYLASFGAFLPAFSLGTVLGYCSPSLRSLNLPSSLIHLDHDAQSTYAAIIPFTALIGGFISGKTIESFGRKCTLIFVSIPMLLGWLLITYANTLDLLYAGRFLTGLSVGIINVAAPVYLSEITTSKTRGLFVSAFQLAITLGVLYSYVIGSYKNWSYLAFYCSLIPVLQIIVLFFLPETPAWLISKNQIDVATETVIYLYGNDHNLLSLGLFTEKRRSETKSHFKLFSIYKYRTPLLLCLATVFFQQMSGYYVILFYTANILELAKSSIDVNTATIYIGLVQVLFTMFACLLVDRMGRKNLLYISGCLMGIAMMILSLYYFLLNDDLKNEWGGIPLISLIMFVSAYSIGYGPIPWVLMGELIPSSIKGLASSLVTSFYFITIFILTWKFQDLAFLIQFKFVYLFFSLVSIFSVYFTKTYLPESKGKSLAELEFFFEQQNLRDE